MSRHWKEPFDEHKHRDFMSGYQVAGGRPRTPPPDNLVERWVYFVSVASFTFEFNSLAQIKEARDYFGKKVHPARREPGHELEHYWQRWFERLPAGLNGGTKREKVLMALEKAIEEFGAGES